MRRDFLRYLLTVILPALILGVAALRVIQFEGFRIGHPPPQAVISKWPPPLPPGFEPSAERLNEERQFILLGTCVVALVVLAIIAGGWSFMATAIKARREARQKTDFVSNVTHELKTPLTSIRICAELLLENNLGEADRHEAAVSIRTETDKLQQMIANVLDFSRLEAGHKRLSLEETDLAETVRETVASLRARFPSGCLRLNLEPVVLKTDPQAVKGILVNLLDNAAKYAASSPEIEIRLTRSPTGAALTVADRGPGLPEKDLPRLFERFWRADTRLTAETGGFGLGLTVCRQLATGLGGQLSVANRQHGGLSFTLELPACPTC